MACPYKDFFTASLAVGETHGPEFGIRIVMFDPRGAECPGLGAQRL
jgi:hypothetical protein